MVKGISRRVVVVDAPDKRFFEQAIFIVRNDAAGRGVTSRELVREARRVAQSCSGGKYSRFSRFKQVIVPLAYMFLGAGVIGLFWLLNVLQIL